MADTNNIVRFADFPRVRDRAASGRARMLTVGDNDTAYDAAVRQVETAPATTIDGIAAKFERLATYLEALEDGDDLTPSGWQTVNVLRHGIAEALHRMAPRQLAS